MSENEAALQEENPDTEPSELVLIAARAFKQLSAEQKQVDSDRWFCLFVSNRDLIYH